MSGSDNIIDFEKIRLDKLSRESIEGMLHEHFTRTLTRLAQNRENLSESWVKTKAEVATSIALGIFEPIRADIPFTLNLGSTDKDPSPAQQRAMADQITEIRRNQFAQGLKAFLNDFVRLVDPNYG